MEIEKYEHQVPECEPDLHSKTQQVQHLFKFKSFYDQMDVDAGQHLANTKVIIELTDILGAQVLFKIGHTEGGDLKIVPCFLLKG